MQNRNKNQALSNAIRKPPKFPNLLAKLVDIFSRGPEVIGPYVPDRKKKQ